MQTWQFLLVVLAGWIDRQQQDVIAYLQEVRLMYAVTAQADAWCGGDFARQCWRKPTVAVWPATVPRE